MERREHTPGIFAVRFYPDIDITGGSRMAEQGECEGSDDNELHILFLQGEDYIVKISMDDHGARRMLITLTIRGVPSAAPAG